MPDASRVPGPRLPKVAQTLLFGVRTVPFLEWCRRRYGEVFSLSLLGTDRGVWITDPALIKQLYARDRENEIPAGTTPALEPMFGLRSIFLAQGAEHRRKRRLLMPPFHGDRVAALRASMVAAIEREIDRWHAGEQLALAPRMSAVTEDVMFDVVFGLGEGARQRRLREALVEMVDASMRPAGVLLGFFARGSWPRRLPLTPWGRLQRLIDRTHALLREEICLRRVELARESREDVLSLLLQARDDDGLAMDDDEVLDELMSLLLAGAESSATTLAWAFDFLLHHPDELDRLRAELEHGEETYLAAVLQETMRLRPVAHLTARRLASPLDANGFALAAGTTVVIPAHLVHRRADVYPAPDEFRPERFLDGTTESYSWLPFGGGIRRCIGAALAQAEMAEVIRTVVTRVDLRPTRREPEPVVIRGVTLVPRHGTPVVVQGTV